MLDATPLLGRTALLSPQQVQRALRREIQAELPSVPGLDERSRLLAGPVDGKVLAVGATLSNNSETLASLRDVLLIAGPVALVLASLAGYLLAGLSLRPVERMRRARPRSRARTSRAGCRSRARTTRSSGSARR